jgi:hypothetical protein
MVGKERHCMSVPFRDECCIVKHPIPHRAESTVCLIIFGANLLKINKAISYNEPIQREMVFRFLSFHFMKLKILHLKRKEENRLSRSKGTGICSVPSCRGERERETVVNAVWQTSVLLFHDVASYTACNSGLHSCYS